MSRGAFSGAARGAVAAVLTLLVAGAATSTTPRTSSAIGSPQVGVGKASARTASSASPHNKHHRGHLQHARIVGGKSVPIREYPYQVAWLYKDILSCGASILSPEWLISAAHCFPNSNDTRNSKFRAGSAVTAGGGQERSAIAFHQHPNWTKRWMDWDVGLIRVDSPLELNEEVQPIRVVEPGFQLANNTSLTVTGWGLTEEYGQSYTYGGSYFLQKADLMPVSWDRCAKVYKSKVPLTPHMLCAQGRNKDACQGDSGGPLTITPDAESPAGPTLSMRLLGLVSWGSGCAREKYPGVYTDLRNADIRHYIETVTGMKL